MHFHIITLFPEACDAYLSAGLLGRAQKQKKITVSYYNPRDFTNNKHRTVDDRPYGGGPGMVMKPEPLLKAIAKARGKKKNVKVLLLSPSGKQFTTMYAIKFAKQYKHIILIAGRYEGIDARVKKITKAEEISIGPYTLTGGEVPAMAIVDSVSRQIDGVLGNAESVEERRIASSETYTRPETLVYKGKKYHVPGVLMSGDHAQIIKWRKNRQKGNK